MFDIFPSLARSMLKPRAIFGSHVEWQRPGDEEVSRFGLVAAVLSLAGFFCMKRRNKLGLISLPHGLRSVSYTHLTLPTILLV